MRFDKYTIKAQEAVSRAQELAQTRDNAELTPVHLLASLLAETEGVVTPLIQKIGADAGRITQQVTARLDQLSRATGTQLGVSRDSQDVFAQAQKEADRFG